MTNPVITPAGEADVQPLSIKPTRAYSAQAIRCVVKQQYPTDPDVWPEALDLISHLCGVDLRERSHDIVMGDPKALSLTAAASDNLQEQIKAKLPTEAERDLFLGVGSTMIMVIEIAEQLTPFETSTDC